MKSILISMIENIKSIHLDIYPQNTLPFTENPGIDIISGLSTSIEVNQKQYNRSESPYSNCQPTQNVKILSKVYVMGPNFVWLNVQYKQYMTDVIIHH